MKPKIIPFFVFSLALMLSGCSFRPGPEPGTVTMSGLLGSNVQFGSTRETKSTVTVNNRYQDLYSMEFKLQVITYPPWAFRGDGNDPLLGTPPSPRVVWESRTYTSQVGVYGKEVSVDRVVLRDEFVAVLVTWYDASGRCRGKGSEVFRPGSSYYTWHQRFWPAMGHFGVALNYDAITSW